MRIAVVHNGNHDNILQRFGRPCPERYNREQVKMVASTLGELGHKVTILEGDASLPTKLREFLQPTVRAGRPPGLVFNLSYGIQGEARYTHVPAMLEMEGVPYTGSTPLGHALALDKVITKILLERAGVPTPRYAVIPPSSNVELCADLTYPLVVKPRHESTSYGLRLVHDASELATAASAIHHDYQQAALVEEYVDGRELCLGLLGNDPVECLPPVELQFGPRHLRLMTWDDKFHKRQDEPIKICPAPVDAGLQQRLEELAIATFRACGLFDYARVDIRVNSLGEPYVLEINSMASLGGRGSLVHAATSAGYSFRDLIARIVDVTLERYSSTIGYDWNPAREYRETAKLAASDQ